MGPEAMTSGIEIGWKSDVAYYKVLRDMGGVLTTLDAELIQERKRI